MNTQEMKNEKEMAQEKGRDFQEQVMNTGADMYAKTQQAATEAYGKTAKVAGETYDQAKAFSRENPEKVAAIAFGVGLGLGILLCSRQSRTTRSVQSVLDAVYGVASAFLR